MIKNLFLALMKYNKTVKEWIEVMHILSLLASWKIKQTPKKTSCYNSLTEICVLFINLYFERQLYYMGLKYAK